MKHEEERMPETVTIEDRARIFRKKHGLDGIQPPRLFFLIDPTRSPVSVEVMGRLTMLINNYYAYHGELGEPPRCESSFTSPEQFIQFFRDNNWTESQLVYISDGRTRNSCLRIAFRGVAPGYFPDWCEGRARFCGIVQRQIRSEQCLYQAARRLFDSFVNVAAFQNNLNRLGLPYGQPPIPRPKRSFPPARAIHPKSAPLW